jgi:hypothetical protein
MMKKTIMIAALMLISINGFALRDKVIPIPSPATLVNPFEMVSAWLWTDSNREDVTCWLRTKGSDHPVITVKIETVNFFPQMGDSKDGEYFISGAQTVIFTKYRTLAYDPHYPSTIRIENMESDPADGFYAICW